MKMSTNKRIARIRKAHEEKISIACEDSTKVSALIRSVVFAGFALIWIILQGKSKTLPDILLYPKLKYAAILLSFSIILEFIHLVISVSISLVYAIIILTKAPSYCKKKTMHNMLPTSTPHCSLYIQWGCWYAKSIAVIIAYILILLYLLNVQSI